MATIEKPEVVVDGSLENDGGDGDGDSASSPAGLLQGFEKVLQGALHDGPNLLRQRS